MAIRHDVDVTDDEFERAVLSEAQPAQPAAQKVMQHAQALACNETQSTPTAHEKTPDLQGSASSCETLQSRGMEAAGIEPASEIDSTDHANCDCDFGSTLCAANALHFDCFKGRFLASLDAELQRVVSSWCSLDEKVRRAILALV